MTSPRPLLAVVVPARDNHDLTRACVRSVARAARSVALEILVVDDGSAVPVSDALADLGLELRILRHERSVGFTKAANAGLRAADSPLLLLLNNDTELDAGALAPLVEAFQRDPGLGIAGGTLYYPDGAPQWSGGREPSLLWLFALASGLPALLGRIPGYRRWRPLHRPKASLDWVTGAALALRREVWREVGPFDEGLGAYAQDLDLCLRAKRLGWAIRVLPDVRLRHHHGATMAGATTGGAGSEHPEKLWTSLLAWSHKEGGARLLRRARLAFGLGGRIRLVLRAVGRPFVRAAEAPAYDRSTRSYRAALRAVGSFVPPPSRIPRRLPRLAPIDTVGSPERPLADAGRRIDVARSLR